MAAADELIGFVRESLSRGIPRVRVESLLIEAGWSRDQVDSAIGAFADVDSPVPVPRPRAYLSAREAFIYLLLFAMLYVSAFQVGVLLFDYINRAFPDPADRRYEPYAAQAVRWAVASLIVAFPVFTWLQRHVNRQVRLDPAKRRSHVRRWLTYVTVFIASCVIIGDVTTLIYNALAGELTVRFILKVLSIALIAGTALLYYLSDLRLEDTQAVAEAPRWHRALRVTTVGAVAVVALAGLPAAGTPSAERARRLDERRVEDLRALSDAANVYVQRHSRLPGTLQELSSEGGLDVTALGRETGPYEYRATGDRSYELCATFQRPSPAGQRLSGDPFWAHGAGRQCFQLEVIKKR